MEALLMKFPNIYINIHNLGAVINMLQTKNKSIETIYFSKILSIDPLPTGIDTPSSQDGKYFDELTLAIVAFSNHKVSTTVEISDQTTVVDTDVYYSHESINVSDDATIGDTTKKSFC